MVVTIAMPVPGATYAQMMLVRWRPGRSRFVGVLALSLLCGAVVPAAQPRDGRHVLDFEATTLDGKVFRGRNLDGRVVLLDFWAVWCRPCIEAFPKLNALDHDFSDRAFDVIGVTVHSGSAAEVAEFLAEYAVEYQVVVAEAELAYRHDVIGVPTYLLVGRDGAVYKRYVGDQPALVDRVRDDVLDLLK